VLAILLTLAGGGAACRSADPGYTPLDAGKGDAGAASDGHPGGSDAAPDAGTPPDQAPPVDEAPPLDQTPSSDSAVD
jgi:hypothetical protein